MIAEWAGSSYVIALAAGLIFAPGLALLAIVRVRGLMLVAFAPVMSIAMTSVSALVLDLAGIGWTPVAFSVAMLVILAVGLITRWLAPMPHSERGQREWFVPIAIAIGGFLTLWRLIAYIQHPDGISQSNDAIFHLNAVRYILETHSASALDVSGFIGGTGFYPAAWHGITSMLVLISGADIAVAANAVTLVVGAAIWPLGIAWLTKVIFRSDSAAAAAGILAAALQTFPILMFQWGVLYPNALSTAMLPAALAVVLSIPEWLRLRADWRTWLLSALLVMTSVGAIALAQPATLLAGGLVVSIWLTSQIVRSSARIIVKLAAIAVTWGGLAVVWYFFAHSTSGSHWGPFRGRLQAGLDILTNAHIFMAPAIAISVFMLIGLVVATLTAANRWVVVAWAGISALYFVAATVGRDFIRVELLGAWYADPYRVAALAPLLTIPLAAYGLAITVRKATGWWAARSGRETSDRSDSWLTVGVASLVMIVITLLRPVPMPTLYGEFETESLYVEGDSTYLSTDERQMLESLDELLPADARVIANPSTGSGFGYMLSGLDVNPKTWAPPVNEDWWILAESLRDVASVPEVCDALATFGSPQYVLDFGIGGTEPGRYEMPGMTDFDGQPGFSKVAGVGDVSVWQITACAE